jgi:hypothetical protein
MNPFPNRARESKRCDPGIPSRIRTPLLDPDRHFPGRERDEKEVLGYYAALETVEQIVKSNAPFSETNVRAPHGFVMAAGVKRSKPTPYCEGQNVHPRQPHARHRLYAA